jgi:hypothetical protein
LERLNQCYNDLRADLNKMAGDVQVLKEVDNLRSKFAEEQRQSSASERSWLRENAFQLFTTTLVIVSIIISLLK